MQIGSFRAVIELWPSREAMAAELGAKSHAVSKWWQRDRIPSEWWHPVLASPVAKDAGLSSDLFIRLGARDTANLAEVRA